MRAKAQESTTTRDVEVGAVTSADGTAIAYERRGEGPPLLVVDGALCSRSFGPTPKLAALLASHFSVIAFDRRGRGQSGDSTPYAVEREVEDVAAVAAVAGGPVAMYGSSSGAVLAVRAAAGGVPVRKLVLYEPPLVVAGTPTVPPDRVAEIVQKVREGRRGDAVDAFMHMVGAPAFVRVLMRFIPGVWSNLKAVAHTLPYDFAVLGDTRSARALPAELAEAMAAVRAPTLVGVGGKSPAWMRHAVDSVTRAIPGATMRVLAGQTHAVSEKAIGPVLIDFLQG
jgi:pimeloyl-ACP methyl ester carboxylesterase